MAKSLFKRKFGKYFLFLLIICSCQERQWKNPFDPSTETSDVTPTDFHIDNISENKIELKWSSIPYENVLYIVERKTENEKFAEIAQTYNTHYSDTVSTLFQSYAYRMVASLEDRFSPFSDTLTIERSEGKLLWSKDDISHVFRVNFSLDNTKLLCTYNDGTVKVLNVADGSLLWQVEEQYDIACEAIFSPDNQKVILGRRDSTSFYNKLDVLNAEDGMLLWSGDYFDQIYKVAMSSDNSKIAASSPGELKIWKALDGSVLWTGEHNNFWPVEALEFSPDNNKIVSGGGDSTIKVWDANNGALIWTGKHMDWVYYAGFSPDNRKIVSGSLDGTINIWDSQSGSVLLTGNWGYFTRISFSSDGTKILYGGGWDIVLRDAINGSILWTATQGGGGVIWDASFSPDESKVVSGGTLGIMHIWDSATGQLRWSTENREDLGIVSSVNFSSDNRKIVCGGEKLTVWDAGYHWNVINID